MTSRTDWDHTDPAWVHDPYPIREDLRERCPVGRTNHYAGGWFPTTHEMVASIANDTDHFKNRSVVVGNNKFPPNAIAPIGGAPPHTSEPPTFSSAGCASHLAGLGARSGCGARTSGSASWGRRFSTSWATNATSMPYARMHLAGGHREGVVAFPDEVSFASSVHVVLDLVDLTPEERTPLFMPMAEYFERQIEDHIAHPRGDFTSYLLGVGVDGEKLPIEHVRGTMPCWRGSPGSIREDGMGAAIWHLAKNPSEFAVLVEEPGLIPLCRRGVLRFYAPVTMARLVKEDFDFHGCPMKKDDWVLLGFPRRTGIPKSSSMRRSSSFDRVVNRQRPRAGYPSLCGIEPRPMELRVAIEEFIGHQSNSPILGRSHGRPVGPRAARNTVRVSPNEFAPTPRKCRVTYYDSLVRASWSSAPDPRACARSLPRSRSPSSSGARRSVARRRRAKGISSSVTGSRAPSWRRPVLAASLGPALSSRSLTNGPHFLRSSSNPRAVVVAIGIEGDAARHSPYPGATTESTRNR